MISKHVTAHSFYHTCRYIEQKPGAELLLSEGVRSYDVRLMAEDFVRQQQLRPTKTQACLHAILSFYPGENPSDDQMKEISKEYFKKLGIENTQYAVTKHTDRAHLHLHIVANMVNNEGKAIKDSWLGLKGKKIAQELTQKYELRPALEKDLKLTHLERLSDYEMGKYKIYIAIKEQLPIVKTMKELELKLEKLGIETSYKYKGKTEEKQGISFRVNGYSYKGSEVDRKFSLKGLEQTITQSQKIELKNSYTRTMQTRFRDNEKMSDRRIESREIDTQIGKDVLKGKANQAQDIDNKLVEKLTQDEQKETVARELTEENKRKIKRANQLER